MLVSSSSSSSSSSLVMASPARNEDVDAKKATENEVPKAVQLCE